MPQPPPEFYRAFPHRERKCRACGVGVQAEELFCAACGAPRPAQASFAGEGYEWRTQGTWMGFPLIHIAFGLDATGQVRRAEGVLAVGQKATGALAIGLIARGFISVGIISFGVFSFGIVALGGLAAFGLNALAPYAIGLVAAGYWAGGVSAWGWKILFSAHP